MSATIVDLYVNLIGNDASLLAASKRSARSLEGLAGKTTTVKDAFMKVGKASALMLTAIAGYSVKAAADFQSEMELISTQANVSQKSIKGLSDQVLAMSGQVGIAPVKLAEGLYHIESAGFRGHVAMEILRASAMNAAMGMSNLEDSSQAVIGVMAQGLPDIKNAADAAAILNTTVGIGDMRMQALAKSIQTGALSVFKVAGLGMKDFSAGLATMTDNVTPAQVAATRLRMAISLLSGPSGVSMKALEAVGLSANQANAAFKDMKSLSDYGINLTQLSADLHQPNGLLVALEDLQSHLKKSGLTAVEQTAVISRAFGGARTAAGIEQLLSELPRLQDKYKKLGDSTSRLKQQQEGWANQQKTFKQQTHELGAAVQVMAIKLGTMLLPTLTKVVTFLTNHQTALKAVFAVIVIGLTLITAAWIAMSASMLANPVFWVVVAIIAGIAIMAFQIYFLVKHWKAAWTNIKIITQIVWDWLKSAWDKTWGWIKHAAMAVWGWLVDAWQATWNAIKAVGTWIYNNIIRPIVNAFNKFFLTPFKAGLNLLVGGFKFAFSLIRAILIFFWAVVSTIFKNVTNAIATFLAPAVHWLEKEWNKAWSAMKAGIKFAWDHVIHPVFNAVAAGAKWLAKQVMAGVHFIVKLWKEGWDAVKKGANIFWDFLKKLWGYIKRDFLDKIGNGIKDFKKAWSGAWNNVKDVITTIWNKHIKPIIDKITGAINKAKSALDAFIKSPAKFGQKVGNWITGHFKDGGPVPGPSGRPMLAVVHGGEYVLSEDMLRGRAPMSGLGRVFSGSPSGPSTAAFLNGGGGGFGRVVVNVDGKELFDIMVTRSQRHKKRNTSTFLT